MSTAPAPFEDPRSDDREEPVQSIWTVEQLDGAWQVGIYDIYAGGDEEIRAAVPLDPTDTVNLAVALDAAYQDMTGEPLIPEPSEDVKFNLLKRETWSQNSRFTRLAVLVVVVLVVVFGVINLWENFVS